MSRKSPFLGVLLVFFAASGDGSSQAQAATLERLEASVNSSIILLSDVGDFRKTLSLRKQLDPLFNESPLAAKGDALAQADIVRFLVDERMIAQAFPVTDSEVDQEINSIQASNRIDRASLRRALQDQGFSFDQYFELIRVSASKKNLIDRDIRSRVAISDDDLKNYYYNHYKRSAEGTKNAYHLKMMPFSLSDYKSPAMARETAQRARQAVRSGETFDEVAKRFVVSSEASDLGVLTEDAMSVQIRNQVRKLKKGDSSEVFGGPELNGFYIVYVADVKISSEDGFERVKNQIAAKLSGDEYQKQIALWLERQKGNSFVHFSGQNQKP